MEETKHKIILFDGICNLCNGAIQFVIKRDTTDTFRYAALQSDIGKELAGKRNIDMKKVDSIILIDPGVAYYMKSTAALEIGKNLKGYRTISSILLWFPGVFRDFVYDFVASNRYSWYGKKDQCMVPTPDLKAKFLD